MGQRPADTAARNRESTSCAKCGCAIAPLCFLEGRAVRLGRRVVCPDCARRILVSVGPPGR